MNRHPLSSLDAEIADHIARETQDNIDRGMTPEDARAAALRRFGNALRVHEDTRAVWVPAWLDQLRQDVRYALRLLVRHPGFSCAAIVTLAFGIGMTTAMFSVVHSVLLRPLPYVDANRIVMLRETLRGRGEIGLRMAVGAQRFAVIRLIVGHGLRLSVVGVAIGVPAALLQAQVIRNLLYEVEPTDLTTFTSVVVLLILTGVLAALVPAVKAAHLDPLQALRHE